MDQTTIRVIVTIAVAVILAGRAFQATAGSKRRLAFWLGAGAFALFSLLNGLPLIGITLQAVTITLMAAALVMFLASVLLLFQSYRAGEMQSQFDRIQKRVIKERERLDERERQRTSRK